MDALSQPASVDEDADATPAPAPAPAPPPAPASAALPVSSALDARFLALAGTLSDIVSLHETARGCVYASAATRSLLGAEPADLVGRDWAELVPPEDDNPFDAGAAAQVSHRMLRPYGPPLVAETTVTPVEENGDVVQLLCVTRGFDTGGWELPDSLRDRLTGLPTREVLLDRLGSLPAYRQMAGSAVRIAERVRAVVARPLPFEPVIATASVGAALVGPGGDPEAVLRLAARAAQAVKRRRGNAAQLH